MSSDSKVADAELSKQFAKLVAEKPAADVVELDSKLNVRDAVRKLVHSKVLAAPVYDADSNTYAGWVDTRDLAAHIVQVHSDGTHRHKLELGRALLRTRAAEARPVTSIVDLSSTNEFRPVTASAPLGSVLTILSGGLHRIPVVDTSTGRVVKIISQSDIVKFLADRTELLGDFAGRSLADLGLGAGPVEVVQSNQRPLDAFKAMFAKRLSALPVVDASTGAIVTNVSASDIKVSLPPPCARARAQPPPRALRALTAARPAAHAEEREVWVHGAHGAGLCVERAPGERARHDRRRRRQAGRHAGARHRPPGRLQGAPRLRGGRPPQARRRRQPQGHPGKAARRDRVTPPRARALADAGQRA